MRYNCSYISHVERDFQIVGEKGVELWVEVQHFQQVVTMYFVEVTICQRSDIARWFTNGSVQAGILSKNIIFTWEQ